MSLTSSPQYISISRERPWKLVESSVLQNHLIEARNYSSGHIRFATASHVSTFTRGTGRSSSKYGSLVFSVLRKDQLHRRSQRGMGQPVAVKREGEHPSVLETETLPGGFQETTILTQPRTVEEWDKYLSLTLYQKVGMRLPRAAFMLLEHSGSGVIWLPLVPLIWMSAALNAHVSIHF
jgi:hypothetical protein